MITKTKISIAIDSDSLERIDAVAETRRQSRSEVISRILRNGVTQEENLLQTLEHPLAGPLVGLLLNERVVQALAKIAGQEVPTDMLAGAKKLDDVGKELRSRSRRPKTKLA